ncbi:MAG: SH3 domain-containing protein [Gammaproteobacteria bacterium]|nr:SH3 domain-containing protein [Gammaproteobacteria bacterium]
MNRLRHYFVIAALLLAAGVTIASVHAATSTPKATATTKMAPTPGTTRRETEFKDKPAIDAKTLKRLPANAPLTIIDRSGGWYKVLSAGRPGWVRLLHVSSQPAHGGNAQDLEAVAKLATGRAGSGNIVSTTGIRGLNEEQLRTAQPNPEELKKLESYTASKEQAADYARKQRLARHDVPYLPESP